MLLLLVFRRYNYMVTSQPKEHVLNLETSIVNLACYAHKVNVKMQRSHLASIETMSLWPSYLNYLVIISHEFSNIDFLLCQH